MKQKQIIALVSATALAVTALAGCGRKGYKKKLLQYIVYTNDSENKQKL